MPAQRARDPRGPRGRAAEEAACRTLRRLGYEILARNVRLAGVEIDVIALEGSVTVFVEVRSRSSRRQGSPLETVGFRKQARIARAASAYLARRSGAAARLRFDVVGVDWNEGRPLCTVVRDAFESPF